jgi:hypothetical protein
VGCDERVAVLVMANAHAALMRMMFVAGAFSACGQARLRTRNEQAYAAVIQMRCNETVGRAAEVAAGGRWHEGVWRIEADDQLKVCTRLLRLCQGPVVDGLRRVALFRIGQPFVKPGTELSDEVKILRRMLVDPKVSRDTQFSGRDSHIIPTY